MYETPAKVVARSDGHYIETNMRVLAGPYSREMAFAVLDDEMPPNS